MRLMAGTRLGPYEIVDQLGAGGMGEVYRARDTRLGREVALKILTERLSGNPQALNRFEREARTVAALSHPNILALHDFGRDNDVAYAVMELLDGEPLDRRLAREDIPWKKAIEIGIALAEGLASAHSKGIVHRDLKPANIFITRTGHIKILDFGLATLNKFESGGKIASATNGGETEPGTVLGTIGYMAPEQVKGEAADPRSDIFALGCILYELLTARRAFRGDTPAETMAAILRDQPADLVDSGRKIPQAIDTVLRRCLEKEPEERFQSARDLAFALREMLTASGTASVIEASSRPAWSRARIVAVTALVLAGIASGLAVYNGAVNIRLTRGGSARVRSLVVLPLRNLSGDPEQEYVADAMTEQIITDIARLGKINVFSRTSTMSYKGSNKSPRQIARELQADTAVEGSIARSGSTLTLNAQLIDLTTDKVLWADSYERDVRDVPALQREIARAVASKIEIELRPEERTPPAASHGVEPEAYQAYVKARYFLDKRTEDDLTKAVTLFQHALDVDPLYAAAYAGMADGYGQLGYGSYISPDESFPLARAAAQKALALDPTLADAHASLGWALMYYDWKFTEAEAEYKRAIQLNPSYSIAHQWYAYWLTAMEHPEREAEREIATAKQIDPLSVPINTDQAYMLYYSGKSDEALKATNRALAMNPRFPLAYFWLGRIYTTEHRYDEAEAAFQRIGPLRTWTPAMAALGFLYGKSGRRSEAQSLLGEFADLARRGRYPSSYAIAVIYAGLGEREQVFKYLEASYRERSHWLVWLKRDPRWDDVRSDPRFTALVRKVGLPS